MLRRTTIPRSLYDLERSDVGIVQLDRELRVIAMNRLARRILPVEEKQPFEKMVLSFHPERSVPKVKFLLDQAECPVGDSPPTVMLINIPERVLLIKLSKMSDLRGDTMGYTLVFHDITDDVSEDAALPRGDTVKVPAAPPASAPRRQLRKIPTVSQNHIGLVDADDVIYIRAEGHYTQVATLQGVSFCNLNIGDLEARLDDASFLRIHRSYLANLRHAELIVREKGKTVLKLRGEGAKLPVSRAGVPQLLERLGIAGFESPR